MKSVYFLLHLASIFIFSQAQSIVSHPHALKSQNFNSIQKVGRTCSFIVIIKTSCSSIQFTRDQISLAFGDAYGNKIYAPRIDDPTSRRFERCVSDTFQLSGECTYQICHVAFYRSGSDGWKPESVTIYGFNSRPVTFYYKRFIPKGIWFGFNHCSKASGFSLQAS
ncbi:embryo-specific protein ATS3B-like [Vitis riparia]|uniref:embryo-specific protein ATS3B-like n=1 Tax=Vitis riparia TaxID=96939 RepID=UPI00155B1048|nr:embryo-specific protein ATS3B-like [Vitis riparia]